jgi:dihydrofolate reductase
MRRIVVFDNVTADGYFADSKGSLDWVIPSDEVFRTAAESNQDIDTMLFGRRTYEMFEQFWPHALDDPETAPDPHTAGRRSAVNREMAVWINETNKIVFSRTRKHVTWKHSQLIPELEPKKIEAMKAGPGKDMIVFGSGSLVAQLTGHGLIDEYMLVVNPILLGGGRPLLTGLSTRMRLDLRQATDYKSGHVLLRYGRRVP